MRFYVYCESDEPGIAPYVMAEVVRDEATDRSLSLAATLAGPRARIMTRTEMRRTTQGRSALERWDVRDDTMFERETSLLTRTSKRGTVHLHVVDDPSEERRHIVTRLPADEKMRQAILMSRGLREATRQVIERARALRAELKEERKTHEREAGENAV